MTTRSLVFVLALLCAQSAMASEASLSIPLMDRESGHLFSHMFNAKLKAKRMAQFPDAITVSSADLKAGREAIDAWRTYFDEKVQPALKADQASFQMYVGSAGEYDTKEGVSLCYHGNPTLVGGLTQDLSDNAFSDQYTVVSSRVITKNGERVVKIVSHADDDGSSLVTSFIQHCAK